MRYDAGTILSSQRSGKDSIFIQLVETHLNVLHWKFYLLCLVYKCLVWNIAASENWEQKYVTVSWQFDQKKNTSMSTSGWLFLMVIKTLGFSFSLCDRRFGEYTYAAFSLIYESSLNLDESSRNILNGLPTSLTF